MRFGAYRPVIPTVIAGLVLLLLDSAASLFLGAGLIMGVYCLDMYTMLVSADVALRRRIPVAWVEAAGAGSLTGPRGGALQAARLIAPRARSSR